MTVTEKKLPSIEEWDEALTKYSRTEMNLCKNDGCYNGRRKASAYCQECSNKPR